MYLNTRDNFKKPVKESVVYNLQDASHNPLFEVALKSDKPLAVFLREKCQLTGKDMKH